MSITSPGVEVDGPACVPARFSLYSVAEVDDREDGHWQAGNYHRQLPCGDIQTVSTDCVPGDVIKDTTDAFPSFPESDAFALVAPYDCSTGGSLPLSEAWDLATERLTRSEIRSVERAFWTGLDSQGVTVRTSLGQNPDAVDLTPVAGAVSITDGVALLESWAGENMACAPIIHAARGLGTYFAERNLVHADFKDAAGVLRMTGTGSRVAIGGGYLVSGPMGDAPAAGEGWIYVTGSVKVTRGPVFHTPTRDDQAGAVDRLINDVTVYAERMVSIATECGIAAIKVKLCGCC